MPNVVLDCIVFLIKDILEMISKTWTMSDKGGILSDATTLSLMVLLQYVRECVGRKYTLKYLGRMWQCQQWSQMTQENNALCLYFLLFWNFISQIQTLYLKIFQDDKDQLLLPSFLKSSPHPIPSPKL